MATTKSNSANNSTAKKNNRSTRQQIERKQIRNRESWRSCKKSQKQLVVIYNTFVLHLNPQKRGVLIAFPAFVLCRV